MPYIAAGGIIVLAAAGTLYILSMPGIIAPETKQTPTTAISSQQPVSAVIETVASSEPAVPPKSAAPTPIPAASQPLAMEALPTVQEQAVPPQTTKLTPSMHFMQDFESDVMDYYFEDVTPTEQKAPSEPPRSSPRTALPSITPKSSVPPAKEVVLNEPEPKTVKPAAPSVREESEPPQMLIQRDDDMKDIQDVIARFKKNKNPALSLFVAKRYYKIGNYQQAYNYALITNELDNNIEDSWLIFAKSLYKLDQKDMAIKTLRAYIQESSSVKAKITLDQMEKGTF